MEIRSVVAGAAATVMVGVGVFFAVAVSNAQEAAPVADQQATIATLTARLDAVEDTLNDPDYGMGAIQADLVNLSYRVSVLENP